MTEFHSREFMVALHAEQLRLHGGATNFATRECWNRRSIARGKRRRMASPTSATCRCLSVRHRQEPSVCRWQQTDRIGCSRFVSLFQRLQPRSRARGFDPVGDDGRRRRDRRNGRRRLLPRPHRADRQIATAQTPSFTISHSLPLTVAVVADLLAEQRDGHRRDVGNPAMRGIGLVLADDLPAVLLAVLVLDA